MNCWKCGFETIVLLGGRPLGRRALLAGLLALAGGGQQAGLAQSSLLNKTDAPLHHRRGFHIYSASSYFGYSSLATPPQSGTLIPGLQLGSDVETGGAVTFGWNRPRERSKFSLLYTPSYTARRRYTQWNSMNHSLTFAGTRRLSARWSVALAGHGVYSGLEHLLFFPTVFSRVADAPRSFADLAEALAGGRFTNDQLASILTGAPVVESPAHTLAFGDRLLNSTLRLSFSYSPARRWTLRAGAGARQTQRIYDRRYGEESRRNDLPPRSVGAEVHTSVSYAANPRTFTGFHLGAARNSSLLHDNYVSTGKAFLRRALGRHWFVEGHGGVGMVTPIRWTFQRPSGLRLLGGGSAGLNLSPHIFLVSHEQTVGDLYGMGAGLNESTTLAWRWWPSGRTWGVHASGGRHRAQGSQFSEIEGWLIGGGWTRGLSRHTALRAEYAYLRNFRRYLGTSHGLAGNSVRLSFVWTPGPEGFR